MLQTVSLPTTTSSTPMSQPRLLLHLEGLAINFALLVLYATQGYSVIIFMVLLLLPDLSMVGYLANAKVGSMLYNAFHTYILPLALAGLALALESDLGLQLAIIWGAHIALDRALGYGLKYATQFKDTHFQRV